ncbi:hypothetical protein D9M68_829090 [compost metagenome]
MSVEEKDTDERQNNKEDNYNIDGRNAPESIDQPPGHWAENGGQLPAGAAPCGSVGIKFFGEDLPHERKSGRTEKPTGKADAKDHGIHYAEDRRGRQVLMHPFVCEDQHD